MNLHSVSWTFHYGSLDLCSHRVTQRLLGHVVTLQTTLGQVFMSGCPQGRGKGNEWRALSSMKWGKKPVEGRADNFHGVYLWRGCYGAVICSSTQGSRMQCLFAYCSGLGKLLALVSFKRCQVWKKMKMDYWALGSSYGVAVDFVKYWSCCKSCCSLFCLCLCLLFQAGPVSCLMHFLAVAVEVGTQDLSSKAYSL